MKTKQLGILLVFGLQASMLFSQESSTQYAPCKFTLGVIAGAGIGNNDINKLIPKAAYGLSLEKKFHSGFVVALRGTKGTFAGGEWYNRSSSSQLKDKYDYKYSSNFNDLTISAGFNISRLFSARPALGLSISSGVGIASFKSSSTYHNWNSEQMVQETYVGRHVIVPIVIDLNYKVCNRLRVGVGLQYNFTHTDNLDIISPRDARFDKYGLVGLTMKYKLF